MSLSSDVISLPKMGRQLPRTRCKVWPALEPEATDTVAKHRLQVSVHRMKNLLLEFEQTYATSVALHVLTGPKKDSKVPVGFGLIKTSTSAVPLAG